MRIALVVAVCFLNSFAIAQTSTFKKSTSDKAMLPRLMKKSAKNSTGSSVMTLPGSASKAWYTNHLSTGIVFTSGNEVRNIHFQNDSAHGAGELSTQGGIGLMVQYKDAVPNSLVRNFDWTASLTVQQSHDLNSVGGTLNGQNGSVHFGSKPSFQPWIVAGNAEYRFNDKIYLPFGVNTTAMNVLHNGDLNGFSMGPQLGYQIGLGATLDRNLSLELMHQSLRYTMSARVEDFKISGYAVMDSFNFQGRYNF